MAISTYPVYLHIGDRAGMAANIIGLSSDQISTHGKLLDIKDFPDLGGAPEMLESTTLSDKMQTYIMGIQSQDALEFTANYTKADYDKVKELEGKPGRFILTLGEPMYQVVQTNAFCKIEGSDGTFVIDGVIGSVYVAGAGVNEVVEMKIVVVPGKPITSI